MSDDDPRNVWDDGGPRPSDDNLDEALCYMARSDLQVFAQYVLRNEQPDVSTDGYEDDDEARNARELFSELADAGADDEDADHIALQPYHLELLDAFRSQRFVAVTAHTESGKTQLGIAYVLWQLGRHPGLRVAILSEGGKLARTITRTIARYIGEDGFSGCQAVRRVFPELRPGRQWNVVDGFEVERSAAVTHPSFAAFGSDTGLTGYRADIILCDDYVTPKSVATPYLRKQLGEKFNSTVYGRKTQYGQIIFLCNAQWEDDPVAVFESKPGVHRVTMRVTRDGTADGPLEWPEKWPRWRIRQAVEQNPDHRSQLFAVRRKQGTFGRFTKAMTDAALDAGRGLDLRTPAADIPDGYLVCIGVDFAFSQSRASDRSAIVAVLRYPNGKRELLHVAAGKWREADGLRELATILRMYPKHRVRAESNSGQRWIIESWAERLQATIEPYRTDGSKWSPVVGVPALAADMANHRWVFPCDHMGAPEAMVAELIEELHAFDPDPKKHTGDLVMALFFADGLARDCKPFEYQGGLLGDAPAQPVSPTELVPAETPWTPGEQASAPLVDMGSFLSAFR